MGCDNNCRYLIVDVYLLCHLSAHTLWWHNKYFLWTMWLLDGLSGSILMLLSTFSYTKIWDMAIFIVNSCYFKGLCKNFFSVVIIWFKNYSYLCTWTISLSLYLSQLDVFFHGISEAAYAVLSMAESHDDKAIQSGHWVGKMVQT